MKQAELVDSVDAKRALAEECEKKGMWADAIRLYEAAATGIFADDPAVLTGLARAQLGGGDAAAALETLDKLEEVQPRSRNQEAHLLHARALEALGRTDEALAEYDGVSRYYAGFEAKARYGLLLLKQGTRESGARNVHGGRSRIECEACRHCARRQGMDQDREVQPALTCLSLPADMCGRLANA